MDAFGFEERTLFETSFLANPLAQAHEISVETLEKYVEALRKAYYNSKSVVSDEIYDQLEAILRKRRPDSRLLSAVGADVEFDPRKTELPYWMGSLDKVKTDVALDNWLKRYTGPYVVSHKLDGISALLVIDKVNKLYTRGSGDYGLDISHLIEYLGLTIKMESSVPVAIRGEIIMSKKNWTKYSATNSNSRNMVSGLVNAKHPDVTIFRDVDFVAYEIVSPDNLATHKQFHRLEKWGFKVAPYQLLERVDHQMGTQLLTQARADGAYQIDGVIITQDAVHQRNTSGNPKYSIAFKNNEADQGQVTTVRQVLWSPTRHGYLKPRIEVEPVQITNASGNVTIRFCTAFNGAYIKQNRIGPGSIVEIVRSGDVIPYISAVVLGTEAQLPCNSDAWAWNESGVDIILKDPDAFGLVLAENLTYFFKTMGARYVSDATISKFIDAGYVSVASILTAPLEEIAGFPGLGQKSAERIREALDTLLSSFNTSPAFMAHLMAASGSFGQGLGVKKLQLVLEHYPDCLSWHCEWSAPGAFSTPDATVFAQPAFRAMVTKVVEIPGFADKTASKFVYNLPNFQDFLANLPIQIEEEKPEPEVEPDTQWAGQRVVFSGFRNAALEQNIIAGGGTVTSAVTSKTTLVLVRGHVHGHETASGKVQKAHELNIPVKTLSEI